MILASFVVQVTFSDYEEDTHASGYLTNEKLLPESTIGKHNLSPEEWEEVAVQEGARGSKRIATATDEKGPVVSQPS